jgi:4'-phosphopantetheinyl transferase EntD
VPSARVFPVAFPVAAEIGVEGLADTTGSVEIQVAGETGQVVMIDVLASTVAACDIALLIADERIVVTKMAPGRAAEFATGRRLLRSLLHTFGPLDRGPDGRPTFPPGTPPASMSHNEELVVAVACSAVQWPVSPVTGIGVDIERFAAADHDGVREQILRREEQDLDATLALVIKEASFKAASPGLRRQRVSFLDLTVTLAEPDSVGGLRFSTAIAGRPEPVVGEVWTWGDRWCAIAVGIT